MDCNGDRAGSEWIRSYTAYTEDEIPWSPLQLGGFPLGRDISHHSIDSTPSQSSNEYSPFSNVQMPYNGSPTTNYDGEFEATDSQFDAVSSPQSPLLGDNTYPCPEAGPSYASTARPTPTSLGWVDLDQTAYLPLYTFVVKSGKEPYLKLLPDLIISASCPPKVYLDSSK